MIITKSSFLLIFLGALDKDWQKYEPNSAKVISGQSSAQNQYCLESLRPKKPSEATR
jgi:hypothetical protein